MAVLGVHLKELRSRRKLTVRELAIAMMRAQAYCRRGDAIARCAPGPAAKRKSMSTSLPRDAWVQFGDEQGVLFASAMICYEESVSRFPQGGARFPSIRGVRG